MTSVPPGLILVVGGFIAWALPRPWRSYWLLMLPAASLAHQLMAVTPGTVTHVQWFDLELAPVRADRLAAVWSGIFHLAAVLSLLYGLHERDRKVTSFGLIYAGSAIAAVYAGDLLTLFLWWELTAISSVFLVWAGRSECSYGAGMRYLIAQVASGVLLLAGTILRASETGEIRLGDPGQIGVLLSDGLRMAEWLILAAFGIKAAFPLLHAWLPDAYPESTPAGTVFLSAFTTKLAIYALVRGFAGYPALVTIGCVMAVAPLVWAMIEDDVRRSLAYCLNNQLGFMVVAAGVGSELAVNGAAAHAVAHILYKGLLFMAIGAVMYRTGATRASQLGGLAATMPTTFFCYLVGAAAISAPLFCGFVTKSLTLSAVAQSHLQGAWVALIVATAGVFFVCGLRIMTDVFLGDVRSPVQRPLPWNMGAAMISAAVCCGAIGVFPTMVYQFLPFPVTYHAYTVSHVVEQLQILIFASLAFVLVVACNVYPWCKPGRLLDVDWLYRRPIPHLVALLRRQWHSIKVRTTPSIHSLNASAWKWLGQQLADDGRRGRFAATGRMAMAATIMLVIYLMVYYR